jgi:hypothetical protein
MNPSDDDDTALMARESSDDDARPHIQHTLGRTDSDHLRRYGISLDLGVPDGATAALALRPIPVLRVDAGVSYNGVSTGERVGVTYAPLAAHHWITPTLSIDAGHYAEGDANPLVRLVTGNPAFSSPALDRVGYDYASAQAGVELGRERATFYLRAGVTRVTGSVHNLGAAFSSGDMPPVTFGSDPSLTLTALSARIGFITYFK